MISVAEALAQVLERATSRAMRRVPLLTALGAVLAEAQRSDIDSPPHDKALMDGYAVLASDITPGVELSVLEEVTAGELPSQSVTRGAATRIMTGAPIPTGADAVVMVEQTTQIEAAPPRVRIEARSAQPGQNIMRRGSSMQVGDVVLRAGRVIRPIEVGVLAEIGVTEVPIFPQPTVAILSTGNELVPPSTRPQPGQIRNSNGAMLEALVLRAGGQPVNLGIGRDDPDELRQLIQQGLGHHVLVLSGGVSAGVLDLVPDALAANGVTQIFHKVHLKPGKPVWFGTRSTSSGQTLVFGLPGNPVSSLVCFELFVRPALQVLAGQPPVGLPRRVARLNRPHSHRGDRPTYYPARLWEQGAGWLVEPLDWKGSADLRTLADADCLAYFPPSDHELTLEDSIEVFLLR